MKRVPWWLAVMAELPVHRLRDVGFTVGGA